MDLIPAAFVLQLPAFVRRYAAACLLCLCIIIFAFADTSLVSFRNARNILSNAAPLLLAAAGTALCLFSGYIDLSAGAIAGAAAAIAASFMQAPDTAERLFPLLPPLSVFLVVPAVSLFFFATGMLNGFLIKRIMLPPWFATLASGILYGAVTKIYLYDAETSFKVLEGFTRSYSFFGTGYFGINPVYSIPFTLIFSVLVFALTVLSVKIFLPDINLPAMHCNIKLFWPVSPKILSLKQTMLLYGIASVLFALSGMMISARAGSTAAVSAVDFGVQAVTVCFIASLSLFGGRGNWTALVVSVLIFSGVTYAADFVGINRFLSSAVCSLILSVSAAADIYTRKKNAF